MTEAVILMAGTGSRLRATGGAQPKPLIPIAGRPLISYTIDALVAVGVTKLHAVVGYESEALLAGLQPLLPAELHLHPISNPAWREQNGVSVLCAAHYLTEPFLLLMGDHLFEKKLLQEFVRQADPAMLNLAIDRKIERIFDLDDAMKVQTVEGTIGGIGKSLEHYDAIDTGIFFCPPEFFHYLELALNAGDCSLADGVRAMASDGKARVVDIGDAWWQDVDDVEMLRAAEARLTTAQNQEHAASRD